MHSRRAFSVPTPEKLANAALFYLERYAASESALRRVLQNKIRRAALRNQAFAADTEKHAHLAQAIEKIIEKHKKTGVINDAAYADMKISSLGRAGKSHRRIGQTLRQKGLAEDVIEAALGEPDEDQELEAARKLFKKRRFDLSDPKAKLKAFATLARAGFSPDVIRSVLRDGEEDL